MAGIALSPQLKVTLGGHYELVAERLRGILKAGGFCILHQNTVAQLAKPSEYGALHTAVIIGAYAPQFVYRAYITNPASALLASLHFLVRQVDDDLVEVSLIDPRALFDVLGSDYLRPIAQEFSDLAIRMLDALEQP